MDIDYSQQMFLHLGQFILPKAPKDEADENDLYCQMLKQYCFAQKGQAASQSNQKHNVFAFLCDSAECHFTKPML